MAEHLPATLQEAFQSTKDRIADRIKSSFVELMPDELWKSMVQKELQWFTTEPPRNYYDKETVAPLRGMIREAIRAKIKEDIVAEIGKPEYEAIFGGTALRPGEAVRDIIKELLPEMVVAMFQGVVHASVDKLRQELTRHD